MSKPSVAILGTSGFSGALLAALLQNHPLLSLDFLGAHTHAGKSLSSLYPAFHLSSLPPLSSHQDLLKNAPSLDIVFCGLPHDASSPLIDQLLSLNPHLHIIDLSASLRLKNPQVYKDTYNLTLNTNLIQKTVYGLSEIYRDSIASSSLVANPGCYPTAALLPLIPLLQKQLIDPHLIHIDAKSGVSGAGRKNDALFSFCHINGHFKAYALEGHRHEPEINQELSFAHTKTLSQPLDFHKPYDTKALFIPHLVPMARGILCTLYVKTFSATSEDLFSTLSETYENEPFVHVLPLGDIPSTAHTLHTNNCAIGIVKRSYHQGGHIIVSVIDNLMKGASGQALQNLNIMRGWPETTGLQPMTIPL